MRRLSELFEKNKEWAKSTTKTNPTFFQKLSQQQAPEYLWIGCADSRVPANQVIGLDPGEVFVHRNVANLVVHTDLNCLSVMQFAVEALKVKHIIVCGHYGCGGIKAAMLDHELGLIENWLRHIQDIRNKHLTELEKFEPGERIDRMCELNVIDQVVNVCRTTIVRDAWKKGQDLTIHGWVYGLQDGLLRDLEMCVTHGDDLDSAYAAAVKSSLGTPTPRLPDPAQPQAQSDPAKS